MTLPALLPRIILLGVLFFFVALFFAATHKAHASPGPSPTPGGRIGILAKQGDERCLSRWRATADYLSARIPGVHFSIIPLHYDEIDPAVANAEVDFILINPAQYVRLEARYRATRIATIHSLFEDQGLTLFGGTVFGLTDGWVKGPSDLPGATVAAVDGQSLGGWLAFLDELRAIYPELKRGPQNTLFLQTHDKVVEAVRDGKADAGIVRSGTLERWAEEGKIRLEDFRIYERPRKTLEEIRYPYALSTPLYPEWPMAKLEQTPEEIARLVAAALLEMPTDSPAAKHAEIMGWTVPLNYESVHNLLKALKIDPYDHYGEVSVLEAARQHWIVITAIALLVAGVAGFAFRSVRLNRRLIQSRAEAQAELEVRREAERRRNDVERMVQHELRSPLVAVINGLDLLREIGGLDANQTEILGLTRDKARHMLQVVTMNRSLAMMEEGTFVPSPEWTDLRQVLADIAAEYPQAPKSQKPAVRVQAPIPRNGGRDALVAGDSLLYHILLQNLVRNAVEASPPGSDVLAVLEPGDRIMIRVKNQGVVPEKIRDTFFDKYVTSGKKSGTGLGTYTARLIAVNHGGDMGMASSPEAGTEVWAEFPAASSG